MLRAYFIFMISIFIFLASSTSSAQSYLRAKDVSGGETHTLVLMRNGSLYACGGYPAQLGTGDPCSITVLKPVFVMDTNAPMANVLDFDAGWCHSLAVDSTSSRYVYTWGSNPSGQLGDGPDANDHPKAIKVHGLNNVGYLQNIAVVSAGRTGQHSLAAETTGAGGHVWAWGLNSSGQCGNGDPMYNNVYSPVRVVNSLGGYLGDGTDQNHIVKVEAGIIGSLALDNQGWVWRWGDNWATTAYHVTFTSPVPTIKAIALCTGAFALDTNGYVWDLNNEPNRISGGEMGTQYLQNIVAIGAGDSYALALDGSGNLYAWGSDSYSALGNGDYEDGSLLPIRVHCGQMNTRSGFLEGIAAMDAGLRHGLAVDKRGRAWAWGQSNPGRLGNGMNIDASAPVKMIMPAGPAGLSVSVSASPASCIQPTQNITYTLSYSNTTTQTFSDVNLVEFVPYGCDLPAANAQYTIDSMARTVTWHIGNLSANTNGSQTLTLAVNWYAKPGGTITNEVELSTDFYRSEAFVQTPVCYYGGPIIYVKQNATGYCNGASWQNAFTDLHEGLQSAALYGSGGKVWVAKGTYSASPAAGGLFTVSAGISAYGGFAGNELSGFSLDARDFKKNPTTLSGGIANTVSISGNGALDGCIIAGATTSGIRTSGSGSTVSRCNVQANGVYGIDAASGSIVVDKCTVENNSQNGLNISTGTTATVTGSIVRDNKQDGVYAENAALTIKNSVISHNSWCGIKLESPTSATITNCTIVYNYATGIYRNGSSVSVPVTNCILWYNVTTSLEQVSGIMDVAYSCITDPNYPDWPDATRFTNHNIRCHPGFVSYDRTLPGYFHLATTSLCIDMGDPCSTRYGAGEKDIDGDARLYNDGVHTPLADIGADEVSCTDPWNSRDFNGDGVVDGLDLAIFMAAWLSRDPNAIPTPPASQSANWNARVNLAPAAAPDSVIDFKDYAEFAKAWGWRACWRPQPPMWPVMQTCGEPNMPGYTYDPNLPTDPNRWYDPNEPVDPNQSSDPNGYGMSIQSSRMSLRMGSIQIDPAFEAQQLQDNIDFLYQAAAEEDPNTAADMYQFIGTLEQELSDIYGTLPGYNSTQ